MSLQYIFCAVAAAVLAQPVSGLHVRVQPIRYAVARVATQAKFQYLDVDDLLKLNATVRHRETHEYGQLLLEHGRTYHYNDSVLVDVNSIRLNLQRWEISDLQFHVQGTWSGVNWFRSFQYLKPVIGY